MKIKNSVKALEIDDEAFFSWLMGQMLLFTDFSIREAHIEVVSERVGLLTPRQVRVTVHAPVDLLSIGRILKLDPLTSITVFFPALKAEATLNLVIFSSSIDIHVHGKGTQLSKSGTYDSIVNDVNLIYKKCWDGPNIPALYGQTCADLGRLLKSKSMKFIETKDYNWPLFCNTIAKLVTCIAAAEPFRCLLMHPITMMEIWLGKHELRSLNPITNFSGSASALTNIQVHFEMERRDEIPPPLSTDGQALLRIMSDVVVAWAEAVLMASKKSDDYLRLLSLMEQGQCRPIEVLQAMVSQKILRHMSESMRTSVTSLSETVHDLALEY
jgi:hypothetical protein